MIKLDYNKFNSRIKCLEYVNELLESGNLSYEDRLQMQAEKRRIEKALEATQRHLHQSQPAQQEPIRCVQQPAGQTVEEWYQQQLQLAQQASQQSTQCRDLTASEILSCLAVIPMMAFVLWFGLLCSDYEWGIWTFCSIFSIMMTVAIGIGDLNKAKKEDIKTSPKEIIGEAAALLAGLFVLAIPIYAVCWVLWGLLINPLFMHVKGPGDFVIALFFTFIGFAVIITSFIE